MRFIALAVAATALTACTVPAAMPVADAPQEPAPSVLLARSGIIALDEHDSLLAFGSPMQDVQPRLEPILGPVAIQLVNEDCGAGSVTFDEYEDVTLLSQNGILVGWSTHSASLRTDAGIGLGSSEIELSAAYTTEIEVSSLGREFSSEGFYGLIENGQIVDLWAGTSCVFR
ncbi:hypothetical protein SAMN06273572_10870 [Monaibacterium marinum]|uniref:Uncharacterized protein n=1 Tax=Pontivivens marinum TaxID=1690039 RepID=A0A2C9CVA0_9RHOB|nr:hypothetical protein [Monaibacterium marinum]SOH95197.1 hypothetical protein SAMN06273572_10870 [Monaibacterium marinum]